MHVPATFALFATLLALLVLLRIRWSRFSGRLRSALFLLACASIGLLGLCKVTGWGFSYDRLNAVIYWAAIGGYMFITLLVTLMRPRWLTVLIAIVLIVPLLSASIFLRLAELFEYAPCHVVSIGDHFFIEATPWNSIRQGTSGMDVDVAKRNSYLPFLERRLAFARLYNNQCNTSALVPTLLPDRKSVLLSCPEWPADPTEVKHEVVLALP